MNDSVKEMLNTYDPSVTWEVHTPVKDYRGRAKGVNFVDGYARLDSLPKGAPEHARIEHAAKLAYFADRGYHLEKSRRQLRDD